jgi:hypothetical protein
MRIFLSAVVCILSVFFGGCADNALSPSPSAAVVEAGWSFGFCLGPCRGMLQLNGSELTYRVSDRTGSPVLAENRGRLTSVGASRLQSLAAALPDDLLDTYGCPDCADAGAAYVVLSRESATERADYEYPAPPPDLAPLDAFLKGIMEALGECRPSSDVTIAPGCDPLSS